MLEEMGLHVLESAAHKNDIASTACDPVLSVHETCCGSSRGSWTHCRKVDAGTELGDM